MYKHHLLKLARTPLAEVLLDEGVLDRGIIEQAHAESQQTGKQLAQVLIEHEVLDDWQIAKIIAGHYSLPFVDLSDYNPNAPTNLIPAEFCFDNAVLPLEVFGPGFTVAACQMPTSECIEALIQVTGKVPFIYVVTRRQLWEKLGELSESSGTLIPSDLTAPPQMATFADAPPAQEVNVVAGEADAAIVDFASDSQWETIFDLGDDAVKASDEDEEAEEAATPG